LTIGEKNNWVPTDIIPLINDPWKVSFACKDKAIKAIQSCGWGPLNYCLLQSLFLQMGDATNKHRTDGSPPGGTVGNVAKMVTPSTGNHSHGSAAKFFDLLLENGMKNKGKMDAFKKRKIERGSKEQTITAIKELTKISSGKLAGIGHFHLDENVRDCVKQDCQMKKEVSVKANENKADRQKKAMGKYKTAINKHKQHQPLLTEDLKILLKKFLTGADSPMKSKKGDLSVQWNNCCVCINQMHGEEVEPVPADTDTVVDNDDDSCKCVDDVGAILNQIDQTMEERTILEHELDSTTEQDVELAAEGIITLADEVTNQNSSSGKNSFQI
jgi:hypothetical protein